MSGQTVYVQFRYCPLCQLNHKQGKKHVYSTRHKEMVVGAVTKLLKKISEAKEFLKKPSVKDITWDQADQKFWCYICQEDVSKHRPNLTTFGNCVIELGGLLEHIARSDHLENTTKFLKENKLDMKRTTEFIISSQVYLKYLEDVEAVCSQFFMQKSQAVKQVAAQIRSASMIRHDIVASSIREQILSRQMKKQQPSLFRKEAMRSKSVKNSLGSEERGKKTIQAFGAGLTPIDILDEEDNSGNVYSNAVPPWMQTDDKEETSSGVVGPTIEDLEKHRKLERKRQLPACRVGAKFDRKSDQTDLWLPDFGGVWNHGRRTKSAHQFLRRQSKKVVTDKHPSQARLVDDTESLSSYSYPETSKRSATIAQDALISNNKYHNNTEIPGVYQEYSSGYSPALCSSSSEFFNNNDLEVVKSQSVTRVSDTTSNVFNSSPPVSASVNNASFMPVKPYIKKHRSVPATVSEQHLSSTPHFSPQMSYPHSAQMYNGSMGSTLHNVHNSTTHRMIPPPYQPYENHVSLGDFDRKFVNEIYPLQKHTSQLIKSCVVNRIHDVTSNVALQLIATPVISQDKRKLSTKDLHGVGRFGGTD